MIYTYDIHTHIYGPIFTYSVSIIKVFLKFLGIFLYVLSCQNFISQFTSTLHGFSTKVLECLQPAFFLFPQRRVREVLLIVLNTSLQVSWLIDFIGPGKPWYSLGICKEYMFNFYRSTGVLCNCFLLLFIKFNFSFARLIIIEGHWYVF